MALARQLCVSNNVFCATCTGFASHGALLMFLVIPIIFAAVPALLEICSSPSRAKQGALADPFASSAAKAPAV